MSSFENIVDKAKKKEAYIAYELYRLLKNALLYGVKYEETKCEFKDVIPEFPIGEERADLVIAASKYGNSRVEPFAVIEVKVRAFTSVGRSIANAVRKARSYAQELSGSYPFYAIYNGWGLLIFRDLSDYLIAVTGTITKQEQCSTLLRGLERYSYTGKLDLLQELPKYADPDDLIKRVLPSVAKVFVTETEKQEDLLNKWKELVSGM